MLSTESLCMHTFNKHFITGNGKGGSANSQNPVLRHRVPVWSGPTSAEAAQECVWN